MSARDDLIDHLARALFDQEWAKVPLAHRATYERDIPAYWRECAEAALSVVETATSICPECGGEGAIKRGMPNPSTLPKVDCWPCPLCGGQPGPLLILQALGGKADLKASIYVGDYVGDNWEAAEVWRFPRRQEGQ